MPFNLSCYNQKRLYFATCLIPSGASIYLLFSALRRLELPVSPYHMCLFTNLHCV